MIKRVKPTPGFIVWYYLMNKCKFDLFDDFKLFSWVCKKSKIFTDGNYFITLFPLKEFHTVKVKQKKEACLLLYLIRLKETKNPWDLRKFLNSLKNKIKCNLVIYHNRKRGETKCLFLETF